ncbi:hypothetical protein J5N97_024784 [Dioscorea zingiberensis]|uniref:DDE Tnp4 domain-containing protein n=1 Tax=Dioscorea zingiberensis TaxID=325984 RepID=A0A9D5C722_9LILI|nr:hypothetical protein J5N97_024784 [Dioscorea zingiberensis]
MYFVGKYYLVDAGYANTRGLLAPYKGERYHLGQFTGGSAQYRNRKDKFNHNHARLRNIVERAFGILKRRFKILRVTAAFSVETQLDIVYACAVIHNYVSKHAYDDPNMAQEENDHIDEEVDPDMEWAHGNSGGGRVETQSLRDSIARAL